MHKNLGTYARRKSCYSANEHETRSYTIALWPWSLDSHTVGLNPHNAGKIKCELIFKPWNLGMGGDLWVGIENIMLQDYYLHHVLY